MANEFDCIACGAPVEPEAGRERMACPYCNTQLTIPLNLRRRATLVVETPRVELKPKPQQQTEQQVADFLRKAQPVATRAWNTYAWWTWLQRFIPGCLIALVSLCALGCITSVVVVYLLRKG
jgi:predicted RNA-binding Zn-ribbon protein involved in translation (DUF1610 family)